MKKILPIHMGGTIASVSSQNGYTPGLSFDTLIDSMKNALTESEIRFLDTLHLGETRYPVGSPGMDSSDLLICHINLLASTIINHYDEYDGFLITHGTDTMAYTASLLSFMLQGIDKPVILTGSQKTLEEKDNDVAQNLKDALLCLTSPNTGIWIVFGGRVIKGYKSTKNDTEEKHAFVSVDQNMIPVELFTRHTIAPLFKPERQFTRSVSDKVDICFLSHNKNEHSWARYLQQCDYDALIVLAFGLGGHRENIWRILGEWAGDGRAVMVKSQCTYGITDLSRYAVGRVALKYGIFSALDLSLESAFAKVSHAVSNRISEGGFEPLFRKNLIGEHDETVLSDYFRRVDSLYQP